MTTRPSAHKSLFDNPAKYEICVRGWVNETWSDRLEGLAIRQGLDADGQAVCTLEGELQDQAALVGVIVALYELHLPLILVKCLACQATGDRGS